MIKTKVLQFQNFGGKTSEFFARCGRGRNGGRGQRADAWASGCKHDAAGERRDEGRWVRRAKDGWRGRCVRSGFGLRAAGADGRRMRARTVQMRGAQSGRWRNGGCGTNGRRVGHRGGCGADSPCRKQKNKAAVRQPCFLYIRCRRLYHCAERLKGGKNHPSLAKEALPEPCFLPVLAHICRAEHVRDRQNDRRYQCSYKAATFCKLPYFVQRVQKIAAAYVRRCYKL